MSWAFLYILLDFTTFLLWRNYSDSTKKEMTFFVLCSTFRNFAAANEENDNDSSFDSCFDDNSVEEIDIIKKEKTQKIKYDD